MSNRTEEVDRFLKNLDHPLKAEIEQIRAAILDSNEEITECIKWNAPSFRYKGEERLTFKLYPQNGVQLIFHRGVKPKDGDGFAFQDNTGLLKWVTKDRAVVTLRAMQDVEEKKAKLVEVVNDWMKVTTPGS